MATLLASEFYTKDFLYIRTLSDLSYVAEHPIPTDRGALFNLKHLGNVGYFWTRASYKTLEELPLNEGCQMINNRCGTGLAGTYHDGDVPRDDTIISNRIYNIYDNLPRCFTDNEIANAKYCKKKGYEDDKKNLGIYNNYPLIFYLTESLDLNKNDIKLANDDRICFEEPENSAVYKVFVVEENSDERDIGRAVMCNLINMIGDQAGVILHADKEKKIQAFGNYEAPAIFQTLPAYEIVFFPHHCPIVDDYYKKLKSKKSAVPK